MEEALKHSDLPLEIVALIFVLPVDKTTLTMRHAVASLALPHASNLIRRRVEVFLGHIRMGNADDLSNVFVGVVAHLFKRRDFTFTLNNKLKSKLLLLGHLIERTMLKSG